MIIDILSLFPSYFRGPFDVSMLMKARENGLLEIRHTDIRDFAEDKHRRVDDRPFGGGPGMVLKAPPVVQAIRSVRKERSHVVCLSPQGELLKAAKCEELAKIKHLILLCGHYEGIDERAIDLEVDEEISIGDYVLTSGCPAAIVLIDAVARFIPGVVGHPEAVQQDSFQEGIFDAPHFTRPEVFEGLQVPPVLLTGDHAKIKQWRETQARKKTSRVRPDLFRLKEESCEPNKRD
ncbi:MAG TPA: tRNA (guanosine(37)-N1)-methyltransferase TrmD [Chlamydiales bacterium]|nr:tRNA (guanosine(37)-N1)-methyltransferase TrmD [Chlamydiales bacterium]